MREPVCLVSGFCMPFKLVIPPDRKFAVERHPVGRLEVITQVALE
jgi:hypothetical protein